MYNFTLFFKRIAFWGHFSVLYFLKKKTVTFWVPFLVRYFFFRRTVTRFQDIFQFFTLFFRRTVKFHIKNINIHYHWLNFANDIYKKSHTNTQKSTIYFNKWWTFTKLSYSKLLLNKYRVLILYWNVASCPVNIPLSILMGL